MQMQFSLSNELFYADSESGDEFSLSFKKPQAFLNWNFKFNYENDIGAHLI